MTKSWIEQITFSDHHIIQDKVSNKKYRNKKPSLSNSWIKREHNKILNMLRSE